MANIKTKMIIVVIAFVLSLVGQDVLAAEELSSARKEQRIDDDYKLIQLRAKFFRETNAKRKNAIEFSIAEYYFKINDLYDAMVTFEECRKKDPSGIGAFLASVYLYKIFDLKGEIEKRDQIKQEIFNDQFVLLFDQYKVLQYKSRYGTKYEIKYFLDKIEVFLNGDLFVEVSP